MYSQLTNLIFKNILKSNIRRQCYCRWTHRKPLRILRNAVKPVKSTAQTTKNSNKIEFLSSNKFTKNNTSVQQDNTNNKSNEYKVLIKNNNLINLKRNDPKLSTLMLTIQSRKRREQSDLVLLEGKRMIRDAIFAKCTPEIILFSRLSELESISDLLPQNGVKLYQVPYNDLQIWSALTTSPGLMALFKTPNDSNKLISNENKLPITVICDNIREPGNLGSIIRCTAAAGCEKLILVTGCVELWDNKVLRSAAGGHFRLDIKQKLTWNEIQNQLTNQTTVFIADNSNKTTMCDVPCNNYDNIEYLKYPEIYLIIGGETHGISNEAYQLSRQSNNGCRLNIPIINSVDSLNSGMALAIIVFEMHRQLKGYILDNVKMRISSHSE